MNQGKSDIIAKRKVQALFRNKQKYKYDNHMQIMLMNINDVTIHRKRVGLIKVKETKKKRGGKEETNRQRRYKRHKDKEW